MSAARLIVLAVLALPLAAAGCATSDVSAPTDAPAERPAAAVDTLRIGLGETAASGGHTVRFVEVVEDSRCPRGVACVQAGRARVALVVDGERAVLSVPHGRQAADEPSTIAAVEVVGLDPYPGTGDAETTVALVVRPAGG